MNVQTQQPGRSPCRHDPTAGSSPNDRTRPGRPSNQPGCSRRGAVRLLLCTAAIALVWLVVLPWIGRRPAVRQRIEFNQSRRINPDAMFYTDLEVMPEVLDRIERRRAQHPDAFGWRGFTGDR